MCLTALLNWGLHYQIAGVCELKYLKGDGREKLNNAYFVLFSVVCYVNGKH